MFPGVRPFLSTIAALALSSASSFGQYVVSAKSGMIQLSSGAVFVADKPIENQNGAFTDLKENQVLRTEQGRAEILLTPGVFLRVGENSSIRMITNRLIDTRVEFLSGSAMLESEDPLKDNSVTVVYKGYSIQLKKHGLYEVESQPEQMKVFQGEAEVLADGNTVSVKEGRLMPFTAAMATERFDNKDGDQLYRWSARRSQAVSYANVSAARTMSQSGYSTLSTSQWYFNPFFDMFTYIPADRMLYSPFGYGFWSPGTVSMAYMPGYYGYNSNGGGWRSGGSRGSTTATPGFTNTRSALRDSTASPSTRVNSTIAAPMASSSHAGSTSAVSSVGSSRATGSSGGRR